MFVPLHEKLMLYYWKMTKLARSLRIKDTQLNTNGEISDLDSDVEQEDVDIPRFRKNVHGFLNPVTGLLQNILLTK